MDCIASHCTPAGDCAPLRQELELSRIGSSRCSRAALGKMMVLREILETRGESLTDDSPTMVINDLAGQRMYYVLHCLLLTVALTQYVVAVSLGHDLDTALTDEEDQVFGMTHGQNLDFWLGSIFGRAPSARHRRRSGV